MNVTNVLSQEHQLILGYIDLLQMFASLAEDRDEPAILTRQLDSFLAFIEEFADSYHHGKEEEVLFNYLRQPGVLTHCNPVPQMLHEHDHGRQFALGMREAQRSGEFFALIANARSYAELLTSHIHKEDRILYLMAEENLHDAQKARILDEYALQEQNHDGSALNLKYRALHEKLENAYFGHAP